MGENEESFKSLQKKWYQKLKESGFEDIEDTSTHQRYLKTWHANYFIHRYHPDYFESKQEYFRRASLFLHRHDFLNDLEKKIWIYHLEGLSVRKISKKLRELKLTPFGEAPLETYHMPKDKVHHVILRLADIMETYFFEDECE